MSNPYIAKLQNAIVSKFDAKIMQLMKEYEAVAESDKVGAEYLLRQIHDLKNLGMQVGHEFWKATNPD